MARGHHFTQAEAVALMRRLCRNMAARCAALRRDGLPEPEASVALERGLAVATQEGAFAAMEALKFAGHLLRQRGLTGVPVALESAAGGGLCVLVAEGGAACC